LLNDALILENTRYSRKSIAFAEQHRHNRKNNKFELMLTRRAKAYSSFCSQTVSLSPAISPQFILGVCAAPEDRKNQ